MEAELKAIIKRKLNGIDCTEAESAEIKGFLRETNERPWQQWLPEELELMDSIELLFPIEYSEV
jgi:hypothetical protein